MKFSNLINEKIVCFDGAMGSLLIDKGISKSINLSTLNMTDEKLIHSIHNMYVNAGADIITTNTFSANSFQLNGTGFSSTEIVKKGVELARLAAGENLVALDIGPTGYIRTGDEYLNFDYLYNIYKEQIVTGTDAGADIILIETMYDIREARIAILAAKENCTLPVICTLTFGKDNKTLNGTDPTTAVNILQSLGIDAIGTNCIEPERMVTIAEEMLKYSSIPMVVQPNMGIPTNRLGRYHYNVSKETFSEVLVALVQKGVRIVGGCCGTTPECIKLLKQSVESMPILRTFPEKNTCVCSLNKTVIIGNSSKIIGSSIEFNKEDVREALYKGNYDKIKDIAVKQETKGAHILLVSTKDCDCEESKLLPAVVDHIQHYVHTPLMIQSGDVRALEAALKLYNGKALISGLKNSIEHMETVLPIIKKYGAVLVGALVEESGATVSSGNRIKAAERMIKLAKSYGIPEEDIILNCKVTSPSKFHTDIFETLKTIRMIITKYSTKTIVDINNITQELENIEQTESVIYALSLYSGLSVAIIDVLNKNIIETYNAYYKL